MCGSVKKYGLINKENYMVYIDRVIIYVCAGGVCLFRDKCVKSYNIFHRKCEDTELQLKRPALVM